MMIAAGMLAIFVAGMLVSLLIAFLTARQSGEPIMSKRFFGYFIGASASALACVLLLALVSYCPVCSVWSLKYTGVWVGVLIALWPVAAYLWNRRIKPTVLR